MISNNEANNYYNFAVKNLSKLNSSGWLRDKKETIISGDNDFENDLYDALNYQNIETHPEGILKLKPCINKCNWEGIDFPVGPKDKDLYSLNCFNSYTTENKVKEHE